MTLHDILQDHVKNIEKAFAVCKEAETTKKLEDIEAAYKNLFIALISMSVHCASIARGFVSSDNADFIKDMFYKPLIESTEALYKATMESINKIFH